jgi:hypothetical protein
LGTAVVERPEAAVSQPRLYLDEDSMRRSLVSRLRARNVDVFTALEAQMINRGDEDHLAAALGAPAGSIHFYCVLHQAWVSQRRFHAVIVVVAQQRHSTGEELRRLMRLLGSLTAEEMRNRIEFLSAWF